MRVLVFGHLIGGREYIDVLIKWLSKLGYKVDMLDLDSFTLFYDNFSHSYCIQKDNKFFFKLSRVKYVRIIVKPLLVVKLLESIMEPYDIINMHYGSHYSIRFLKLLKQKSHKIILTMWGSDFYKVPNSTREKTRELYENVDVINFSNPVMLHDFVRYYNAFENKTRMAGFAGDNFSRINEIKEIESKIESRSKLGLNHESLVITCGYKASPEVQHFKIIDALLEIKDILPLHYLLLFPLTFPKDDKYILSLKKKLINSGLNYKTFEDYLSVDDICRLRISSDIYITISESDQASASLLEYLQCNNIVIAGEWLPYKFLDDLKINFFKTNIDNLAITIKDILENHLDYEKNLVGRQGDLILNNFGWPFKIKEWQKMFEEKAKDL